MERRANVRFFRPALAAALVVHALVPLAASGQEGAADPYVRGSELVDSGDWLGALALWDEARESLGAAGRSDPRIGIAYIETAVAHDALGYFESACDVYRWGFSGNNLDEHAEVVRQEAERIIPLLQPPDTLIWRSELEQGADVIAGRIRRYWVERDPTPGTSVNERLLEHWRRIGYARENYTKNRSTIYGTDDRGLIYVKYGEPGLTRAGFLGATEVELRAWVTDPFARNTLRRLDSKPAYEVWVYDSLRPGQLTYFLFGNEGGSGRFALVGGVEDLINREAWSPSTRRYMPGGVKAFYYLQLFYYADVSAVGGPYLTRYEQLNVLWGQAQSRATSFGTGIMAPRESDVEAFDLRFKQENRSDPAFQPVFAVRTELRVRERTVELVPWPVRVLSDENEPRLILLAMSSLGRQVRSLGEADEALSLTDAPQPEAQVKHTLIIHDGAYEEIGRVDNWVGGGGQGVSTFTLRHMDTTLHYTVVAEAYNEMPAAMSDTAAPPAQAVEPTAVARTVLEHPDPLSMRRDSLELSDIITGIEVPGDYAEGTLPFPLLPSRKIWKPDPVKVYLEVYHLALDDDGRARFRTDFEVTPVMAQVEEQTERTITLRLDFESETDRRAVAVDITNVPVGAFHLRVRVTDLISGQEKSRVVPLEVAQLSP